MAQVGIISTNFCADDVVERLGCSGRILRHYQLVAKVCFDLQHVSSAVQSVPKYMIYISLGRVVTTADHCFGGNLL